MSDLVVSSQGIIAGSLCYRTSAWRRGSRLAPVQTACHSRSVVHYFALRRGPRQIRRCAIRIQPSTAALHVDMGPYEVQQRTASLTTAEKLIDSSNGLFFNDQPGCAMSHLLRPALGRQVQRVATERYPRCAITKQQPHGV